MFAFRNDEMKCKKKYTSRYNVYRMQMNTILPGHAFSLHFVVLVGGPLQ